MYVATIHLMHFDHVTLALNHGKHVLVEKPMTMNAKQTASVIELAKAKKLFLMEGRIYWFKASGEEMIGCPHCSVNSQECGRASSLHQVRSSTPS